KTAGAQSISVRDAAQPTIYGPRTSVTVSPAAASTFSLAVQPRLTAGLPASVTVTAQDPYGNTATDYTGTVHFTSSDPKAELPADSTFATADKGAHSFTVTLHTAGSETVTAADAADSSITNSAAVSVLVADHFALVQDTYGPAGTVLSIRVYAE